MSNRLSGPAAGYVCSSSRPTYGSAGGVAFGDVASVCVKWNPLFRDFLRFSRKAGPERLTNPENLV